MHKKVFFGFFLFVLILSACSESTNPPQVTDNSNEIIAAEESGPNQPAEEAAASPTVTPSPPLPPTRTLVPDQPEETSGDYFTLGDPLPPGQQWRLVKANYDLWLVNQRGDQHLEIKIPQELEYQVLNIAVSPKGDYVALHGEIQIEHSDLYLWSTVDGGVAFIAELFNGCSPNQEEQACADMWHATGQMAWSPDGRQLAFTSAHLGASSDLYVYDLEDGEIRWLTDGPAQALKPIWTPDNDYILHAAVDRLYFGTSGSGYDNWQYYSAEPDGSKVHTLAVGSGEDRVDQEYLGWVSDHQMLLQSGRWYCGNFSLRMINAVTGKEYIFWHGNYHGAVYNPEMGAALVYVDPGADNFDECGPIDEYPGLYLVTIPDNKHTLLDVDPSDLYGYEMTAGEGYEMLFIQSSEGWLGVSADGSMQYFSGDPTLPQEYWELELDINEIYGWVTPGG